MDIIYNRKGKVLYLVHEGYLFIKEREVEDGRTFWKCTETGKKRKYCKVRLHCKEGQIMQVKGEHTHAPDAAEIDAKRTMAMLFEQKRSLHYMNLILFMITLCELHTISRFRRWLLNS